MERLRNYLMDTCKDNASAYGMLEPETFAEAQKMIRTIFEEEMGFCVERLGWYAAFRDWMFGLCFCSPIGERLDSYSDARTEIEKEEDVVNKIYKLIFEN